MRWPAPERSEAASPQRRRSDLRPAVAVGGAGLALLLAAFTFDATPLFVPGIGFLLLGVLGPGWVLLCARGGRVRRELSAARVVEDEPLEATVIVERGRLGLPGAEIWDPLAARPVPVGEAVSLIAGKARVELRIVARIHRRGRHTFAPPSLRLTDPLGLVRVLRPGAGTTDEVLVLPRTEPVHWLRREHRRATIGQVTRATHEPMGAGEVDGLRPYMPGTPASRIHWPALARGAGLLERRLVSAPQSHPLIVLDARTDGHHESEAWLDAAVRATASLTLMLARAGGCSVLLPGERVPAVIGAGLITWPALHARLALVAADPDPRHAPALREDAARGALIYVAAQQPRGGLLPTGGGRANRLIVVLPLASGRHPEVPASFAVSGCAGYLVRARRAPGARAAA